jgi:hypothetical protein
MVDAYRSSQRMNKAGAVRRPPPNASPSDFTVDVLTRDLEKA